MQSIHVSLEGRCTETDSPIDSNWSDKKMQGLEGPNVDNRLFNKWSSLGRIQAGTARKTVR